MLNIPAFISYVIVTTFTPGPNNIMAMSNASRYGFKKSIPFNAGVFTGFFIIFTLCGLFSVTLFNIMPSIQSIMTYVGAAYILWLAWKTYNSKPHSDEGNVKNTNKYIWGLLLQFVNPKGIIYAITTVSAFIAPYYKSAAVIIGFAIILSFTAFVSNCCWGLFGTMFQRFFVKNVKVVNTIMSLLLVYSAISLFL